jgi:hypothetical protein
MPRGIFARPFNMTRSIRDVQWALPRRKSSIKRCPAENKTFDKYAVIELMDTETTGELQYYCPHCDELVIREFLSLGQRKTEIIDPPHT